jgi:hypothetical protein
VEIIVIKEILCDAGYSGSEEIGYCEEEDSRYCGLFLLLHPIEKVFDAALVSGKKEVDDEGHPGHS